MNECIICLTAFDDPLQFYCACKGTCGRACEQCARRIFRKFGPQCTVCKTLFTGPWVETEQKRVKNKKVRRHWQVEQQREEQECIQNIENCITATIIIIPLFVIAVFHERILNTPTMCMMYGLCHLIQHIMSPTSNMKECLALFMQFPLIFSGLTLFVAATLFSAKLIRLSGADARSGNKMAAIAAVAIAFLAWIMSYVFLLGAAHMADETVQRIIVDFQEYVMADK